MFLVCLSACLRVYTSTLLANYPCIDIVSLHVSLCECVSTCLCVCMSVCTSAYLSVFLLDFLFACLSGYLSACPTLCLHVCLPVCLHFFECIMSVYISASIAEISVWLNVCLSPFLLIYLPV